MKEGILGQEFERKLDPGRKPGGTDGGNEERL